MRLKMADFKHGNTGTTLADWEKLKKLSLHNILEAEEGSSKAVPEVTEEEEDDEEEEEEEEEEEHSA